MPGGGAGEDLGKLGDQRAGDRSATDDDRKRHPCGDRISDGRQVTEQKEARDEGNRDGNGRRDPDQIGQRMFKVEIFLPGEQGRVHRIGEEVGDERGDDHEDAHGEDPDDQLAPHGRICGQRQGEKGDQGDAGNTVGLKAVCRRADAVARIVTRTVGDNAGIFRIVFRQMEDDLHQVGTDIGDLGEDTAADAQRAGAERFTDGKADETGTGKIFGYVGEDQDHEEQFDADQEKPDAHPGAETDVHHAEGIAAQGGERRPGVGHRIDPDAEPGDPV